MIEAILTPLDGNSDDSFLIRYPLLMGSYDVDSESHMHTSNDEKR